MSDTEQAQLILKKAQDDFDSGKISRREFNSVMMTFGAVAGYMLFNSFANAWTGTRMRKSSGVLGYQIQRSLRFRASATAYLSRTLTTPTDGKRWTLSIWVKRGKIGAVQQIFASNAATGYFRFSSSDQLEFGFTGANNNISTAVFRDLSAWYHIVHAVDTTQAVDTNRWSVYVNGVKLTSFTNTGSFDYPSLNSATTINSAVTHSIGYYIPGSNSPMDGYLAELNFIDGQTLTPTSFGEVDALVGSWTAKKYIGTYGANGFYLPFTDTSSTTNLVKDTSGNNNNWTPTNISLTAGITYDSMTDAPLTYGITDRGNYCTLNSLSNPNAPLYTISNGNLTYSCGASAGNAGRMSIVGTTLLQTDKSYWEVYPTDSNGGFGILAYKDQGLSVDPASPSLVSYVICFYNNVGAQYAGSPSYSGSAFSYTGGDIIGMAFDGTAGSLAFYKNGSLVGTYTGISMANAWLPGMIVYTGAAATNFSINFGQRPFSYSVPSGFKGLHTGSLSVPTIKKSSLYFDIAAYAGDSAASRVITNSGMQPDLVWSKARNAVDGNNVVDSVRGVNKNLKTDTNTAETTGSTVTSFNSNGYTIDLNINVSGRSYIGWQWKKGVTPGLDITTYTGDGNNSRQISHSLGMTPSFYITKNRNGYNATNGFNDWNVYHKATTTSASYLMSTIIPGGAGGFTGGVPTSTYFYPNQQSYDNVSGQTYLAYIFAEINGFSKFGNYTGNGSTDGTFVYCGFKPKWLMIKNITNAQNWIIVDTVRNTYNVAGDYLFADSQNGENSLSARSTSTDLDIFSNGFKLKNNAGSSGYTNASGNNYIFIAFAETPFKYASAR